MFERDMQRIELILKKIIMIEEIEAIIRERLPIVKSVIEDILKR